jgi:hypothetical protein
VYAIQCLDLAFLADRQDKDAMFVRIETIDDKWNTTSVPISAASQFRHHSKVESPLGADCSCARQKAQGGHSHVDRIQLRAFRATQRFRHQHGLSCHRERHKVVAFR